jgi:hypothetical protein
MLVSETIILLKNAVFWDVERCRTYLNLLTLVPRSRIFLPWRWRRYVPTKRRFTRSARCHISEDGILHSHRRENLKSYIILFFLRLLRVLKWGRLFDERRVLTTTGCDSSGHSVTHSLTHTHARTHSQLIFFKHQKITGIINITRSSGKNYSHTFLW